MSHVDCRKNDENKRGNGIDQSRFQYRKKQRVVGADALLVSGISSVQEGREKLNRRCLAYVRRLKDMRKDLKCLECEEWTLLDCGEVESTENDILKLKAEASDEIGLLASNVLDLMRVTDVVNDHGFFHMKGFFPPAFVREMLSKEAHFVFRHVHLEELEKKKEVISREDYVSARKKVLACEDLCSVAWGVDNIRDRLRYSPSCFRQVENLDLHGRTVGSVGPASCAWFGINGVIGKMLNMTFPNHLHAKASYVATASHVCESGTWLECLNHWDSSRSVLETLKNQPMLRSIGPLVLLMPLDSYLPFHVEHVWDSKGGRPKPTDLRLDVGDIFFYSWRVYYRNNCPSKDLCGKVAKSLRFQMMIGEHEDHIDVGTSSKVNENEARKKEIYIGHLKELAKKAENALEKERVLVDRREKRAFVYL